jgi:GMP synthase (glutamine-hydrolysing)
MRYPSQFREQASMSKSLLIIKTGSTFAAIRDEAGDFEAMIVRVIGDVLPVIITDAKATSSYPELADIAGIIVTGSHDMVTDKAPWCEDLAQWIHGAVSRGVPYLGICFGHQLLAHAFGGVVDDHPDGIEIGTRLIETHDAARSDLLFVRSPKRFPVHLVHQQSVRQLPAGATLLARSQMEAVQAFRQGQYAWGVQFHPEFSVAVMRGYIAALTPTLHSDGLDVAGLDANIEETPAAAGLLQRFAVLAKTLNPYLGADTAPLGQTYSGSVPYAV